VQVARERAEQADRVLGDVHRVDAGGIGEDHVARDHGGKQVRFDARGRGVDPAQAPGGREQRGREVKADEDLGVGERRR
jgi:hypothetical protein